MCIRDRFDIFTNDILERHLHIEAINYYSLGRDDWRDGFRLIYDSSQSRVKIGDDIDTKLNYGNAIDTSIATGSVVPVPLGMEGDTDRKYWLLKAIYSQDNAASIKNKEYADTVTGLVSVLVSPAKLPNNQAANSHLTISMSGDISGLQGRQLLYFNKSDRGETDKGWKINTFVEEKSVQLPLYSVKTVIEKGIYFSDIDYYLLFNSLLLSFGVMKMLYGCLLYTSPSPRDRTRSRLPSSA